MLKSLALAADQMGGAVSLANEEWDTNTALINEASKRYATTQSQLTMMQNAYKNLKVAIGDAYTPALREAYSVGTDVLNGVAQFIKQNPALVNAITAFAGVLGVVVAALAAYTVGAKVAAAASAMLTAAIPGVNIIMGVAAAVAGVTAAIAALATAADNDAVPSVDELTQAAQGMRDAMDEAGETFENTAAQTVATADVADQYIAKLEEMGDYTQLSNEEQEQYRNTLSLLCQLIPELSDLIDIQNGTIQGGTAALRANTQAWRENAEAQAYQEYMNQLAEQYNEVLVEQAKNSVELTKAQLQIDAAEKKRAAAMARMDELYQDSIDNNMALSQEYRDLQGAVYGYNDEINQAERIIKNLNTAMEKDAEAVADAKQEMELANEAIEQMAAAGTANTDVTAETAAQMQELQSTVTGVREEINTLVAAYTEAYDAALDSITIKATSLPFNAQIRQTEKTKAWEAYTLSGIAQEMAGANGMACLYESASDPYYERVEQYKVSDIKFLSQLCHDAGISLKATNNILVLFDQADYEAKDPTFTVKRGSGSYTKYDLSVGTADTKYTSCRVRYADPATGQVIEGTAYAEDYKADSKNNQQLEVTAKVASIAEAQTLAAKQLRLHNKYSRTATFTFPGDPSKVAGVTATLEGWGAWDGKYIIKQSKHSLGSSGYTTQTVLRRILEGY